MTDEQILKKAIEKAVKNGYCGVIAETELQFSDMIGECVHYHLIFSHDFAKAFAKYILKEKPKDAKWLGEVSWNYLFGKSSEPQNKLERIKRVFLINMVLEKEPLKYIEKFL